MSLQLHMEDLEDQSCLNNLQLQGLPEATGSEDLSTTAAEILCRVLGEAALTDMEFDRIHRALGPRSPDLNRPWDIICRLNRYAHKELVIQRAWESGPIDFDGATI